MSNELVTPLPAATVLLVRDRSDGMETLLLRRNAAIKFYGGAWVFPGGKVDPADAVQDDGARLGELDQARNCASRELFEETGIRLGIEEFRTLSHWTTPVGRPKRFATWFFVAACDCEHIVVDGSEIEDYVWVSPELALSRHSNGEFEFAPPTFVTLQWLSSFVGIKQMMSQIPRQPFIFTPKIASSERGLVSLYHGDVAYESMDLTLGGPRHRLDMTQRPFRYIKSV